MIGRDFCKKKREKRMKKGAHTKAGSTIRNNAVCRHGERIGGEQTCVDSKQSPILLLKSGGSESTVVVKITADIIIESLGRRRDLNERKLN